MREQIERAALPRTRQRVTLRLARQQEKLPLLGAAVLVAQDLFQLPRLRHGAFAAAARNGRNGNGEASVRPSARFRRKQEVRSE